MNNIFINILSFILPVSYNDAPVPWQMNFQEAATPIMEGIISLHNDVMGIIIFITLFVCWMLARTIYLFHEDRNATPLPIVHGTTIEHVKHKVN
jgi:cytochrome c oxidase subunit 2